jgi:hypothetical protein
VRVSSTDLQDEPGLKNHLRFYFGLLALPLVGSLGLLTPFFEQSRLFEEGGWWRSLSLGEQIGFGALGWLIWAAAVTVICLLLSLFFTRWRKKLWKPTFRVLRQCLSFLGILLISDKDLDRIVDERLKSRAKLEADAGPPKGTRSGRPGVTNFGELCTTSDLYSHSLRVEWRSTGLPIGELVPAPGNVWEVHYGHLESRGIRSEFVVDQHLGRVRAAWEGVEKLRLRDLQESQELDGSSPASR